MARHRLTVPEVARQLGIPGPDVYKRIFAGELEGAPDREGAVHVSAEALAAYQREMGRSVSSQD